MCCWRRPTSRLSRSLLDFARIMGVFEQHQVSFVSVTQQFNTSVPVGRLTGTLYSVLLKLEQEGSISSEWGTSDNNRKAKFYRITRSGRKQLEAEARQWQQTTEIIARFFV